MNKEKLKGHIAVLFASTFSAINMPVSKSLINVWIDGYGLTMLRASMACVLFWGVSLFFKNEKVTLKDKMILLGGAFFGMSFNQLMFLLGLETTSTIDAAIISSLVPVFVMILAAFILHEPITGKKAMGVAIGMAGALLIVFSSRGSSQGSSSTTGIILSTVAGISYAVYLIINRTVVTRYSPVTISKWMFLFAAILMLPFGAKSLIQSPAMTTAAPLSVYLRLGFIILGPTFLSYLLVPISLKFIRPTTVSMYNYLQPLVASSIAIAIGQDILTWEKPIAVVLIFAGVYFVTASKSKADIESELNSDINLNGEIKTRGENPDYTDKIQK